MTTCDEHLDAIAQLREVCAPRRRAFPEDPRGVSRDELLRAPYRGGYPRLWRPLSAGRATMTRAEFLRRLAEAIDRSTFPDGPYRALYQLPEPRHLVSVKPRNARDIEATVRAFLAGGPRQSTVTRFDECGR